MGKPFSPVSAGKVQDHLDTIKKEVETYYNALNLALLSPPGAYNLGSIPEKPDILISVEQIQQSGFLPMPGGLLNQPHLFMQEYFLVLTLKSMFESFSGASTITK